MAEKDEFDLDIGEVDFDIEEDDIFGDSKFSGSRLDQSAHSDSDSIPIQALTLSKVDKGDSDSAVHDDLPPDSEPKNEGHEEKGKDLAQEQGLDQDYSFGEMEDDGMDILFSQIDEKEIERRYLAESNATSTRKAPTPVIAEHSPKAETSKSTSDTKSTPTKSETPEKSQFQIRRKVNFESPRREKMCLPTKSPGKRGQPVSETRSFFLTQANPDSDLGLSPAKRKFPGPAGVLPELNVNSLQKLVRNHRQNSKRKWSSKTVLPVDTSNSLTESGTTSWDHISISNEVSINHSTISREPWKAVLQHLNLNFKDENGLLNLLNIDCVKSKRMKPKNGNCIVIPFLAVVVNEKNQQDKALKAVITAPLMDSTGTIYAWLTPSVIQAFGKIIFPGTTIVLRNCYAIKFLSEVVLIVTKKMVMCIASKDDAKGLKNCNDPEEEEDDEEERENVPSEPEANKFPIRLKENGVTLVQYFTFSTKEVIQEFSNLLNTLKQQRKSETNQRMIQPAQLFNVVNDKPVNSENDNDFGSAFDDENDELFLKALQNYEFQIGGEAS